MSEFRNEDDCLFIVNISVSWMPATAFCADGAVRFYNGVSIIPEAWDAFNRLAQKREKNRAAQQHGLPAW